MKIHVCTKPYAIRTGAVPVRVAAGEHIYEDARGRFYRLVRGEFVEFDAKCFNARSFTTTEWEDASAAPGKKRAAKKSSKKDD